MLNFSKLKLALKNIVFNLTLNHDLILHLNELPEQVREESEEEEEAHMGEEIILHPMCGRDSIDEEE